MDIAELAGTLTAEQRECLVGVLEQRGLLLQDEAGCLYGASWNGAHWWVWKLEKCSTEHGVNAELTRCSCEQFARHQSCKHIAMLKHGARLQADWDPKLIKEAKKASRRKYAKGEH